MNDQEIEKAIQEKNLNQPRVRPQDIKDAIDPHVAIQYHVFPGTTVTVCCLTLRNGFCVVGEAGPVSSKNFDAEIGRRVALENAKDKMWPLLGYALKDRIMIDASREVTPEA